LETRLGGKSLYVADFRRSDVAGIPPLRVFWQRVWICLIAKELSFGARTKSLKSIRIKGLAFAVRENTIGLR
jgi:hypothetical protein